MRKLKLSIAIKIMKKYMQCSNKQAKKKRKEKTREKEIYDEGKTSKRNKRLEKLRH
jgi:hypothetical protein